MMNAEFSSPKARDLRVTGNSSVPGGSYDKVKIVGDAIVGGSLSCAELRCIGNYQVHGELHAGVVRLTGDGKAESLRAGRMKVTGNVTISSDGDIGELKGAADVGISGSLKAGEVGMSGSLRIGGDCAAESFRVKGVFAIEGMLNAGEVDVKLHGKSSAKEIGGGSIKVARASIVAPLSLVFHPAADAMLHAAVIEGDDIELKHTHADIVRGSRVTIGEGCQIGLVEYKEQLEVNRGAQVGEQRKV